MRIAANVERNCRKRGASHLKVFAEPFISGRVACINSAVSGARAAKSGVVAIFKPQFAWRGFISQSWFVARVSIVPTLMLTIRYTVLLTFTFNILLTEFGAADFSGTGAALGNRATDWPDRDGVGGSRCRATAMCADLGARTIREDLDALRVMGVNPIQALAVPRVLAATLVSLALFAT